MCFGQGSNAQGLLDGRRNIKQIVMFKAASNKRIIRHCF